MTITKQEAIAGYEALISEIDSHPVSPEQIQYNARIQARLEEFHGKKLGGPRLRDIYQKRLDKLKSTSK